MDLALHRVVLEALQERPVGCAKCSLTWSSDAGRWFTEVEPNDPAAARVSLAFDGVDLVSTVMGETWFELFPVTGQEHLAHVRELVLAVMAGHIEEAGRSGRSFARIHAVSGTVHVGAAHLSWPWRWRSVRRYRSYGESTA